MHTREFVAVGGRAVDLMARLKMAAGAALIAAGVLVALFPQLLVMLLSALIVAAGVGTLVSGWRMRRGLRPVHVPEPRYRVEDFFEPRR